MKKMGKYYSKVKQKACLQLPAFMLQSLYKCKVKATSNQNNKKNINRVSGELNMLSQENSQVLFFNAHYKTNYFEKMQGVLITVCPLLISTETTLNNAFLNKCHLE